MLGTTTTDDTADAALREVGQRFVRLRALEELEAVIRPLLADISVAVIEDAADLWSNVA